MHREPGGNEGIDRRHAGGPRDQPVPDLPQRTRQGPSQRHVDFGLPGGLRSRLQPASFEIAELTLPGSRCQPAQNERRQLSRVQPAEIHALTADGADLVGSIADQ